MNRYYSGIGSRRTPPKVLEDMVFLANYLQETHILRSGGAPGADQSFEAGVTLGKKEIYLPWKGFNDNKSNLYTITDLALEMAKEIHPAWNVLSQAAQKLMARNCYQVLGYDLKTPVEVVVCWTPDGSESHKTRTKDTGGTAQAISLASLLEIPVINMKNQLWKERLGQIIGYEIP